MPGPFMHLAHMEVTKDLLRQTMPIDWEIPCIWDIMEPDKEGPSHGYNVEKDEGNIIKLVDEQREKLINAYRYNIKHLISEHVFWISHYILDALTIGQISGPDLWGTCDDKIDFASELINDKKKDCINLPLPYWKSPQQLQERLYAEMKETWRLFIMPAIRWMSTWWIRYIPPILAHHAMGHGRRAVRLGTIITGDYIYHCWKTAQLEERL